MLPVLAAVTCSGFLIFQAYGYLDFCRENPRPWCNKALPFAYSFVQDHYWNVGFMRYWELKQIPNFLFAAPMLALTSTAVYSYTKFDPSRIRILRSLKEAKYPFFNDTLLPYVVLQAFLVIYGLFMMHVQVVTRMFSSSPVVFWFAGHLCQHTRYRKLVLYYFTWFSIIGAVLFSSFYPPA
jgi:phosphatidylinositol glycan class V